MDKKIMVACMRRCIKLAKKGGVYTLSNPNVGCLLANNEGKVLTQGYHKKFGNPHAEVEVLKQNLEISKDVVLFITLEPCNHEGKTPPCTDLILSKKIKKVVIGCLDPNPLMNGKSVQILKSSGVKVIYGVLEKQCQELNRVYNLNVRKKRAYVVVKFAASLDGKIALADGSSQWISSAQSRLAAQKMRSKFHSIAIGKNTLIKDNPQLNNRAQKHCYQPTRIVFLRNGKLPNHCHFINNSVNSRFVIAGNKVDNNYLKQLDKKGINILSATDENPSISWVLNKLYQNNICSVLVEGGGKLVASFIKAKLIDYLYLFLSNKIIGDEGITWSGKLASLNLESVPHFYRKKIKQIGEDLLIEGEIKF